MNNNRSHNHMKTLFAMLICAVALGARMSSAGECVVPAPALPPKAKTLLVNLPPDGGTVGCTIQAYVPGGVSPNAYAIGNAKCSTSVDIANQAAANDNGWNDGGTP